MGQKDGEEVLFVFRRHVFALKKGVLLGVLLAGLGWAPLLIVPDNGALLYLALAGMALGLVVFLYHWVCWYFSIYIVTDQRIRQSLQKGFFHKSVVDLSLDKIQSAFVEVKGIGAVFRYGTIILHTQAGDMIMRKISQAEEIYAKLQDEIGRAEKQDG